MSAIYTQNQLETAILYGGVLGYTMAKPELLKYISDELPIDENLSDLDKEVILNLRSFKNNLNIDN